MFRKNSIPIFTSFFLVFISACNMQLGPAVVSGTNQDPTAAIQTQVAELVASTAAAQTALSIAVESTLASLATNTPEFTFTPSLTPTPSFTPTSTFTLTPSVPMVSVSVETNCRSGPGTAYNVLGVLNKGQTAEVVGRNASGDTWIIKLPSNPAITCWLWGQYATVVGNTAGLPVSTPPPTPTPAAAFSVSYFDIEDCGGGAYGIKFKIANTGSITWESIRVIATDLTTSESNSMDWNAFRNYNVAGCAFVSEDQNLEGGEAGYHTTTSFSADPTGHNFTVTVRVCSLDGLAGTCLEKTINFTP